jgi:hypothetical protein
VGIQEGGTRGKKRKITINTETARLLPQLTDRDKMSPGMQVQHGAPPGKIVSFANEVVDDIPIPLSMTFVALWEWFLARKKIMIGDFGSAGWQQYVLLIVNLSFLLHGFQLGIWIGSSKKICTCFPSQMAKWFPA